MVVFACFCLAYSCSRSGEEGTGTTPDGGSGEDFNHRFVGDRTCQSCHEKQWEDWKGSHHDYAMAAPTPETVRGDFSDVRFTDGEDRYRFFREDEDYLVEAPGPEGEQQTYKVEYTFGWEPLQQYLVDIGSGKLQALHAAWNTEKGEWFSLYPDETFATEDWLHWTGGAMNWNTMCADCHSTNVSLNYMAEADSFHTTYSGITVGCESCHGPGLEHAELMDSEEGQRAPSERIREDLAFAGNPSQAIEISTCAPCHSLRQKLTNNFPHTGDYLNHYDPSLPHPQNYFADGQIKEEVYVYGSFLQSRMHAEGVQCSDCHDPHSLQLKANIDDNSLCMQCHEPRYNSPEHHFHEPNTESSQCINCHMTGRYYMQVDFRRDHGFRVPRPDLNQQFGTPDACTGCHTDQPASWAAEAVEEWYGPVGKNRYPDIFAAAYSGDVASTDRLNHLIADTTQPEMIRATALWYIGQFPGRESPSVLERALKDTNPLVRKSAARTLARLEQDNRSQLRNLYSDPARAVRLSAVESLSDYRRLAGEEQDAVMDEYEHYLDVSAYFPQGQMNRGQYYEKLGEDAKAREAYRQALERDPYFHPARMNLAYLLNRQGNNREAIEQLKEVTRREPEFGQAWYSLALLLAEENRLEESISYFDKASERMPGNSRVHYNQAIAMQTAGRLEEAKASYRRALELEPENPDYLYGLITLYYQSEEYEKALEQTKILDRIQPGSSQIEELIRQIENQLSN